MASFNVFCLKNITKRWKKWMGSYTGAPLGSETCSAQYRWFGKGDE